MARGLEQSGKAALADNLKATKDSAHYSQAVFSVGETQNLHVLLLRAPHKIITLS